MKDKAAKTIEKYDMPVKGKRVIVALSGGSDSMSLLHVMNSLKDELGFTLESAHVNHCLRGENALRDENFAVSQSEKLGIRCHVLRADVASIARQSGMSVEQAGRKVRYDFFNSLGDDIIIATAHNLNDRVETLLFNLARGASLKGLCSIPPVRDNVIRPLIECSKDEILSYCEENGIEYVTDETNSETVYSRNRIRLNVIPELEKINPGFIAGAGRCIEGLNEDEKFLSSLAEEALKKAETPEGYGIKALAAESCPVLSRAVRAILEKSGSQPDRASIDSVTEAIYAYSENPGGALVQLPGGGFVRLRNYILEIPESEEPAPGETVLKEGENIFGGFVINLTKISEYSINSQKINIKQSALYIDSDKINGKLRARVRAEGDRISPAGRGVTKQLRRLQSEKGIAPEIRLVCPVICDDDGIAAAYLCGVDQRVKTDGKTLSAYEIIIEKRG